MTRETAVTENISYKTTSCDVCGDEVAIDETPDDVIEPSGYAVLLGEGTVTRESEDVGNWDEEIHFELDNESSNLPSVSACLICENCAESIHGISQETTPFTGTLPSEIVATPWQNTSNREGPDWEKGLVYLVGVVFLIVLLLFFL